jgi:hypothetical protein
MNIQFLMAFIAFELTSLSFLIEHPSEPKKARHGRAIDRP